jgi:hypothetical protein
VSDDRRARSAGLEPLDSPEVVLERVGFSRKQQYQKVRGSRATATCWWHTP